MENPQNPIAEPKGRNLSNELYDNFFQLRPFWITFKQILKDPQMVTDDFYYNKNQFVGPIKFALGILGVYVILINIINLPVVDWVYDGMYGNVEFMQGQKERSSQVMAYVFEYMPLLYVLVLSPIWAFWLKKLFKNRELNFSYYYGLITYLQVVLVPVTAPLFIMFILMGFSYKVYGIIGIIITFTFLTWSFYKVFHNNLFMSFLKAAASYILLFISIMTISIFVGIIGGIMQIVLMDNA